VRHRGSGGAYLIGDRTIWSAGRGGAAETTLELTYLAQFRSWLAVQPDVQLVIHPGGTSARRDALVPGLRIALSR